MQQTPKSKKKTFNRNFGECSSTRFKIQIKWLKALLASKIDHIICIARGKKQIIKKYKNVIENLSSVDVARSDVTISKSTETHNTKNI